MTKNKIVIIAETLVNQKIMRNGSPAFTNPLNMLPQHLKEEVLDDAKAVLKAIEENKE